jgi:predicted nucleic acid-binding protein
VTSVVDASVLVAASIRVGAEGQWSESAIRGEALAGPELVLAEATNILRRLELAGIITPLLASRGLRDLLAMPVQLFPFRPFADRIWQLRSNLTCYDAWYVAVAEGLNCPLVTLDRRLSRAAGPTCQIVMPPDAEL